MRFFALIMSMIAMITPAFADLSADEKLLLEELLNKRPEAFRKSAETIFQQQSPDERGAMVRFFYWADKVGDETYAEHLAEVLQPMLNAINGCNLPVEYCARYREPAYLRQISHRLGDRLQLLSEALGVADFNDCDSDRVGIVDSRVMTTGYESFVLFSTSTSDDAPCFVRKVGS